MSSNGPKAITGINTSTSDFASLQPTIGGGDFFVSFLPTFYVSLIVVGIILLFITVGSTSMDNLNGTIAGYSLIAAGILILIGFLMMNLSTSSEKKPESLTKNNRQIIMSFFYTSGPFLVTVGIISYILYLLITYKDRIAEGNIAPGYVSFANISIILILMQLLLFYFGTKKSSFKETSRLDRVYSGLLYFVGILNIITVITIGIILRYFSTDG
uniref:Uncharacterized protein n=1 Tax=viral metagenome TaxID=1070528 RepID=A0A6C0HBX7_9ZZZZ